MEKSIETIWKEGFLKSDALLAPKINDLYNQKSKHLIDKFQRMFKINLIAIAGGSVLFLIFTLFSGMPIMGVAFFLISSVIVVVNKRLLNGLGKIDKNVNSYQYLNAFDNWLKEQLSVNRRMARYYYPLIFLAMVLGFWYSSDGQDLYNEIMGGYHEIYLVNGFPVFWILGLVLFTALLAFFSGRIYNWDVRIVYGRVFKKLNEIIADMEELRS